MKSNGDSKGWGWLGRSVWMPLKAVVEIVRHYKHNGISLDGPT